MIKKTINTNSLLVGGNVAELHNKTALLFDVPGKVLVHAHLFNCYTKPQLVIRLKIVKICNRQLSVSILPKAHEKYQVTVVKKLTLYTRNLIGRKI